MSTIYLASEVKLTSLMSQTTILSPESDKKNRMRTELVFVNLLRSPRIDSQPGGPVRQPIFVVPAR
jgi:hypothetical protein